MVIPINFYYCRFHGNGRNDELTEKEGGADGRR